VGGEFVAAYSRSKLPQTDDSKTDGLWECAAAPSHIPVNGGSRLLMASGVVAYTTKMVRQESD